MPKRRIVCAIVLLSFSIDRSQFSCEAQLECASTVELAYPDVWRPKLREEYREAVDRHERLTHTLLESIKEPICDV